MKKLLPPIIFLLTFCTVQAQWVINRNVKRHYTDKLSQKLYANINSDNNKKTFLITTTNLPISGSIKKVISLQYDELTVINKSLTSQLSSLKKFVNGTSFNSNSGYCSYGYISKKYPIINPLNPSSILKNKIIRTRFYKKLNKESKRIDNYLNRVNPIPEGERRLLILIALENVINITLENETY